MDDMEVIEIDMMAGVIYYGILASRLESEWSFFILFYWRVWKYLEC